MKSRIVSRGMCKNTISYNLITFVKVISRMIGFMGGGLEGGLLSSPKTQQTKVMFAISCKVLVVI